MSALRSASPKSSGVPCKSVDARERPWRVAGVSTTMSRVIALGIGVLSPGNAFEKQGFARKGSENVVGPMPPFGEILKTRR